ncbi:MAG TPA: hypothetical protein PKD05_05715, partial [Candidatus Melainabacteria bacterium]|nr:hypothetical protein [Candidatus Melainabacteria bacterium]
MNGAREKGEFLLFINYRQAMRCGHVGWGFFVPSRNCYVFGSTDHLYRHHWWDLLGWANYMYVGPGESNDWWLMKADKEKMTDEMTTRGWHIRYHAYKSLPVDNPSPEKAEAVARSFQNAGWSVLSNNCVQQTYEIAKAYGAKVPFIRTEQNADDYATTLDVLLEVIACYEQLNVYFESLCCLYPASPLATVAAIQKGFQLLKEQDYDTVLPIV